MLRREARKYSVRMSTSSTLNTPVTTARPAPRMPPKNASMVSRLLIRDSISALIRSKRPNCESSRCTRSLCSIRVA